MSKLSSRLTPNVLNAIVERYDTDRLLVSTAYADGGTEPLRGRLEGGLINQMESGDAMAARYAIWANTVRDNIIAGMNALKAGESAEGYRHLIRAANSLSAFSDAQAYLDPLNMGKRS
ncbi:MAG: hypothetical protein RBS46_12225 [Methyloversatilis sp.]|jgi:hypothetical protein|nr:hypothetical protein [Methyloversatilis sp.]